MKSVIASLGLLVLVVLQPQSIAKHTQAENAAPKSVGYSEVVDCAFQFSRGIPAEFSEMDYRIVVRFLPSWGPESQIVFLRNKDRTFRVIDYRLKKGTRPISEEYNEVVRNNPNASVEDVLKRITVEITEERPDESKARLVEQFFRLSIPTDIDPDLCLDGTTYHLWVQTQSNSIQASLSDCAYGKNSDSTPILRWMKAVQKESRKGD